MTDRVSQDRQEIQAVIACESVAYLSKDYQGWADCWVQEDYARRWSWFPGIGFDLLRGWPTMSATMKDAMTAFPTPLPDDLRRENLEIVLGADMAMVTFDQISGTTGDPFDVAGLQHEMRIMQKIDGRWKILCVSVLKPEEQSVLYPLVQVDALAKVLWLNDLARDWLGQHKKLRLSQGRLRGEGSGVDKQLRAAIAWAAAQQGYMKSIAARAAVRATSGALPVMLGDDESGAKALCWVKAVSGKIFVSFDDGTALEQRLAAAMVVYGLSPGQRELASRIVEGADLKAAAERLGISINTARTHLQRMFDKTGVHNQSALVRVLLSVGLSVG
jgi:DNA-binding CsgD family transcriptional regulator